MLLIRRNAQKRAALNESLPPEAGKEQGSTSKEDRIQHINAFADLTDQENPDFRYDI